MPDRLSGISSKATANLLARVAQTYESVAGNQIVFESVAGVEAAQRVADGENFDVVILAAGAIDKLISTGCLLAPRRDLVRSSTAVAVKAGVTAPTIDTAEALRHAVTSGSSVGYSTGPSGQAIVSLLAQWGLTSATEKPKLIQAKPGVPVGKLIADGDVALGFQQMSELIGINGIQVLGQMPPGLEIETVFSGAVGKHSANRKVAMQFFDYLMDDCCLAEKRRQGMDTP